MPSHHHCINCIFFAPLSRCLVFGWSTASFWWSSVRSRVRGGPLIVPWGLCLSHNTRECGHYISSLWGVMTSRRWLFECIGGFSKWGTHPHTTHTLTQHTHSHNTHTHTHTQHTHTPQLSPENGESYVEYLISVGRLNEAATKLAEIVNDVSPLPL